MTSFTLEQPATFLNWLAENKAGPADLGQVSPAEMWSLVALAALGRDETPHPLHASGDPDSNTWRFARAVGFEDAVAGRATRLAGEEGRTVRLSRITREEDVQHVAHEVAKLILPGGNHLSERQTVQYVLIELVRNVLQHSGDDLGAVVGAQFNAKGRNTEHPVIQVAVADTGRGIKNSLMRHHRDLKDEREALEKALQPHFSGAFPEGRTGSLQNAGLGLFVIAEMAKALLGRMLIASKGAALVIEPSPSAPSRHRQRFLDTPHGFPGTLVAFEMPEEATTDYTTLFARILALAKQRTPRRDQSGLLVFETPTASLPRYLIQPLHEDVTKARDLADKALSTAVFKKQPFVLDFLNIHTCTQSFAHALLFDVLRLAWAKQSRIYVTNAVPAVRSALEMVENYAMGG